MRGESGAPTCVQRAPGEPAIPRHPDTGRFPSPHSPVVWIHDRNEKDINSVPLVENDLVCCSASQDLIGDLWPFQGSVVVGVVAAHIVLRRTGGQGRRGSGGGDPRDRKEAAVVLRGRGAWTSAWGRGRGA